MNLISLEPELTNNYALIGLHSCGNLSNSIINLFLNNRAYNDEITFRKLLCNVACCYNLLNEKYSNDDVKVNKKYNLDENNDDNASQFPMSSYLNQMKYALTFNIRMLACHSFGRCTKELDSYKEVFYFFKYFYSNSDNLMESST